MYPIWKIGRLEDWKIMPPWPSASASLSQAYLAQLLSGCQAEVLSRNYHQRWEMGSHL